MLTRESQLSLGKVLGLNPTTSERYRCLSLAALEAYRPLETGYVEGKAKKARLDASSVLPSASANSRQRGSATKRVHTDGLSSTVPRGDATPAKGSALPEKSELGGNTQVFVLSKIRTPLMPCTPARARELLSKQRAVVHQLVPFTIRLKDRVEGAVQPISLNIDPGSKTTGFALGREDNTVLHPLFLAELTHRGPQISAALFQRKIYRRNRRSRNLRYRPPRFLNRTKPKGWIAPSFRHRVESTMSIVARLRKLCPVSRIKSELVRFDFQKMENPEIAGIEYNQGTLAGSEAREYLLEKWQRCCSYCSAARVPLQIEHIQPKSRGGTNRISNLCLACEACNQKKGDKPVEVFLKQKPVLLAKIKAQAKAPLRDAAAVNTTRKAMVRSLKTTGLPVETASGGVTKYNRTRFKIPKTHALDALCVGNLGSVGQWNLPTLTLKAMGRGSYQRTRVTASGFPRGYLMRAKSVFGFQTGDQVRATIRKGKKIGTHTGRVAIRATGKFDIQTPSGTVQGISYKYCKRVARNDGYLYGLRAALGTSHHPT
jgi:5-methylcytosine-specific restriction endonuclease McrA